MWTFGSVVVVCEWHPLSVVLCCVPVVHVESRSRSISRDLDFTDECDPWMTMMMMMIL